MLLRNQHTNTDKVFPRKPIIPVSPALTLITVLHVAERIIIMEFKGTFSLPVRDFTCLINRWIKNTVVFLSEAALNFLSRRKIDSDVVFLPPGDASTAPV